MIEYEYVNGPYLVHPGKSNAFVVTHFIERAEQHPHSRLEEHWSAPVGCGSGQFELFWARKKLIT